MRIISPTHPPAASPSPSYLLIPSNSNSNSNSNSKQSIDFSPPLIAMVVIAAAAFLIVTYSRLISRHFLPPLIRQIRRYRRWRRRRRLLLLHGPSVVVDVESPHYSFDGLHVYGLDDSVIKSMPLSLFLDKNIDQFPGGGDCAVCLLEFVDKDYVRTLPLCAHSFHVDCIDVWLRSHASCPLCRAGVLPPREWSPFFSERILLDSIFLDPPPPPPTTRRSVSVTTVPEIVQEPMETEDNLETRRPEMLKRSYSFGFERNFSSERLVMDPATASPWRRHHRRGSFSFWRRPSPFSSLSKPRVFSFRSSRKSPFLGRRRGGGGAFVPMSESACIRYAYCYSAGGGGSKSMSMASPMFGRSSASSRMRCGDPEALISPERYGSR